MFKLLVILVGLAAGCATPPPAAVLMPATQPDQDIMDAIRYQDWMIDREATLAANPDRAFAPVRDVFKDGDLMFVATFRGGVFQTTHLATQYTQSDRYIVLKSDATDATLQLLAPDGTARARGFLHFRHDVLTFEIPAMTLVFKSRWAR